MTTTNATALRLAAVSDAPTRPRRGLTKFALYNAELIREDMLATFAEFAVLLGESYAIEIDGIVHLLPANRGSTAHG